jgi:hypothetical protein
MVGSAARPVEVLAFLPVFSAVLTSYEIRWKKQTIEVETA